MKFSFQTTRSGCMTYRVDCGESVCVCVCVCVRSSLHTYAKAVCLVLNDSKIVLVCL